MDAADKRLAELEILAAVVTVEAGDIDVREVTVAAPVPDSCSKLATDAFEVKDISTSSAVSPSPCELSFNKALVLLALRVFFAGDSRFLGLSILCGDPLSLLGVIFLVGVVVFAELGLVVSARGDLGGERAYSKAIALGSGPGEPPVLADVAALEILGAVVMVEAGDIDVREVAVPGPESCSKLATNALEEKDVPVSSAV
jgi:hypothetical protein